MRAGPVVEDPGRQCSQRRGGDEVRADVGLAQHTVAEQLDLGAEQVGHDRLELGDVEEVTVVGDVAHEAARPGHSQFGDTEPGPQCPQFLGVGAQQCFAGHRFVTHVSSVAHGCNPTSDGLVVAPGGRRGEVTADRASTAASGSCERHKKPVVHGDPGATPITISMAQFEAFLSAGDTVDPSTYNPGAMTHVITADVANAPAGVEATVTDLDDDDAQDDVTVTWQAATGGLVTSYDVTLYEDDADADTDCDAGAPVTGGTDNINQADIAADGLQAEFIDLADDDYCAVVIANTQAGGSSDASDPAVFTVDAQEDDTTASADFSAAGSVFGDDLADVITVTYDEVVVIDGVATITLDPNSEGRGFGLFGALVDVGGPYVTWRHFPLRLRFRRMCRTMALDARTRSSIYGKFAEILGDHDANALMSEFPSVEADELVTKQFLRAELGVLRSDLMGEIGSVRSDLMGEIGSVRSDLRAGLSDVRSHTDRQVGALRLEMAERFHRQTVWLASTVVACAGAVIAAVPLLS